MISKLKMAAQNVGNQPTQGAFSVRVIDSIASQPGVSLSVEQCASQLGVSELDVLRLICRGELAANLVAGKWHIMPQDLEASMRVAKRWNVPEGIGLADYQVERKFRERFVRSARAATSDQSLLELAQRQVRPGQPLESVSNVEVNFRSAPVGLIESLQDPNSAREMKIKIRGEVEAPTETVLSAYARSRFFVAMARNYSRQQSVPGSLVGWLYSSPEVYKLAVVESLKSVRNELSSVRETRLLTVKSRTTEMGSELLVSYTRLPLTVSYTMPTEALGVSWERVARESL
jgi:hypothetical protein